MNDLFTSIQKEIEQQLKVKIASLDDKALYASGIVHKLLTQLETEAPQLDMEHMKVSIGKEKCRRLDEPKGYSPGQEYDFVLYEVPVKGSFVIFNRIMHNHAWSENLYAGAGKLYCKVLSFVPIVETIEVINPLKDRAIEKIKAIRDQLDQFSTSDKTLYQQLTEEVNKLITEEKSRREKNKDTEHVLRITL
jgi:hypothetical protein